MVIVSDLPPGTRPWRAYADEALERDPVLREAVYERAIASAVGRAVLRHRTDHGLSQAALGRRIGMPQPQVARIEAGDHTPSAETLLRLADALGLEVDLSFRPRGPGRRPVPEVDDAVAVETTDQLVVVVRGAA